MSLLSFYFLFFFLSLYSTRKSLPIFQSLSRSSALVSNVALALGGFNQCRIRMFSFTKCHTCIVTTSSSGIVLLQNKTKKRNMGDPIISLDTSKIASRIYPHVGHLTRYIYYTFKISIARAVCAVSHHTVRQ